MDKIISVSTGAIWGRVVPMLRTAWIGNGGAHRGLRVGLVGAGSPTGRPLGLLLRVEPGVSALAAVDGGPDAAAVLEDLEHIPGAGTLTTHANLEQLETALADTDLILISGGVAQSPAMAPDALLRFNLAYIRAVISQITRIAPMPFIGLLTEPLNTIFPVAYELAKSRSMNDPKKIFGISTLNALRAEALLAKLCNISPAQCKVPVVGGCSGQTIVPIFSHAMPSIKLGEELIKELTNEIRNMENHIVRNKNGNTCNLSSAFAALAFTRAIKNIYDFDQTVQVSAMVENNDMGTRFLAGNVEVDSSGAGAMERYQTLTPFECDMLEISLRQLRAEIESVNKLNEVMPATKTEPHLFN